MVNDMENADSDAEKMAFLIRKYKGNNYINCSSVDAAFMTLYI